MTDYPKCPDHPGRTVWLPGPEVAACRDCDFDAWWSPDDGRWVTNREATR